MQSRRRFLAAAPTGLAALALAAHRGALAADHVEATLASPADVSSWDPLAGAPSIVASI